MAQLTIGTVQFGLEYGIQGRKKVDRSDVVDILREALKNGVTVLDTASAYGDSESVLGTAMPDAGTGFEIVSKLSHIEQGQIKTQLLESLERLKVDRIYACLFHSFSELKANLSCYDELLSCGEEGLISKAGVSLYYPEEWDFLCDEGKVPDIVQVPFNLFDRRFEKKFPEMKKLGVEIHIRSIFLQGLFCMAPEALSDFFASVQPDLKRLNKLADYEGISVAELVFRFTSACEYIDRIVVGMIGVDELLDNIRLINSPRLSSGLESELNQMQINDEKIILPFNWPQK